MATHELDGLRDVLTALNTRLGPLEDQVTTLRKERTANQKSVKKHMEQNDLTQLDLCGVRYILEEVTDPKCTVDRMRATLPEDVVAQYLQENTVTETKFRKRKIPSIADEE
jgi:hypothetical protein